MHRLFLSVSQYKSVCVMTSVRFIRVNFKFGLLDCVRYIKGFEIPGFVISRFCYTHFTLNVTGFKNIVHYTGGFVILGLRYTGGFVIPGASLYRGLRYTGGFVIPGASLYRGLRYTGGFVIPGASLYWGYVISGSTVNKKLHPWVLIFFLSWMTMGQWGTPMDCILLSSGKTEF